MVLEYVLEYHGSYQIVVSSKCTYDMVLVYQWYSS
jgi:hypothetical protein